MKNGHPVPRAAAAAEGEGKSVYLRWVGDKPTAVPSS